MKISFTLLLLLIGAASFGQTLKDPIYVYEEDVFISDKYKKQDYPRFPKKIDSMGNNYYRYGDKVMHFNFSDMPVEAFVLSGFNPDVLFGEETTIPDKKLIHNPAYNYTRNDSIDLCCLKELDKLNPDEQTRRFRFWLFTKRFMNPVEYYLEFYNKNATKETTLADFFNGAVMTFYYQGGVII